MLRVPRKVIVVALTTVCLFGVSWIQLLGDLTTERLQGNILGKEVLRASQRNDSFVLINSYQRSGSTFLGKMLGWRNDTFYFFEPLWSIDQYFYRDDGEICHYSKLTCDISSAKPVPPPHETMLDIMVDVYNCDFHKHYPFFKRLLSAGFLSTASYKNVGAGLEWRVFSECREKKASNTSECFRLLEPLCRKSKHRMSKVLRSDLSMIAPLLDRIPNLKIVQLFRDPRGIINSHIHTNWYKVSEGNAKELEEDIRVQCSRLQRDMATADRLMRDYPDRVKVIQYEDFDDILHKAAKMFEFLGMTFSDVHRQSVIDIAWIDAERNAPDGFNPFGYRKSLKWSTVETINRHCSDVIVSLGLVKFESENTLRQESLSPRNEKLPYHIG